MRTPALAAVSRPPTRFLEINLLRLCRGPEQLFKLVREVLIHIGYHRPRVCVMTVSLQFYTFYRYIGVVDICRVLSVFFAKSVVFLGRHAEYRVQHAACC